MRTDVPEKLLNAPASRLKKSCRGGEKRILAGDPDFEPFFTLPDADEGDDDGGSGAFEARLMADLRQALTGFGILVRMLEHGDRPDPDHMDKAFKGDARVVRCWRPEDYGP